MQKLHSASHKVHGKYVRHGKRTDYCNHSMEAIRCGLTMPGIFSFAFCASCICRSVSSRYKSVVSSPACSCTDASSVQHDDREESVP